MTLPDCATITRVRIKLALFPLFLFLLVQAISGARKDSIYPRRLISGVYHEKLPNPIFYDTFIPIIYEYQLPEWNKTDVTFNNWYTCVSESSPYKYTCPTVFHMNKAIMNLHIDFESLQPVQDSVPHSEYYNTLFETSTFCDNIQKHFSGIFIQEEELNNYIDALKKCHQNLDFKNNIGIDESSSLLVHMERSLGDYNYSIRAPYSKMENNYYNSFFKPMNNNSTLDLVASATLSNARTTIQANLLTSYYAEKYRWFHALQDCQQQILPHSLVTLQKLNETLTEIINKQSFNSKFELSIPIELISKYYSLPMSDCTYTSNSFVVRLLLPVSNKDTKYKEKFTSMKLRTIPFHYESKLCHVDLTTEIEENIIYDNNTELAYSTICQANKLCQVTEFQQPNHIDHCATGIITNNFTATKDNCEFECKDVSSKLLDIGLITKISPSKFIVTTKNNQSKVTLNYQMVNHDYVHHQQFKLVDYGALEVTLPCKSKLVLNNMAYYSGTPCNESTGNTNWSPNIEHIEPWHLHFSDKMDENETAASDPFVVHYYLLKKAIYLQQPVTLDESIAESFNNDDEHSHSHSHPHQSSQGVVPPLAQVGSTKSTDTSHGLLWATLIISVLLLFTIQLYIIYQIKLIRRGKDSEPITMQNMMHNLRGNRNNDPEPEFHLLNNDQQ